MVEMVELTVAPKPDIGDYVDDDSNPNNNHYFQYFDARTIVSSYSTISMSANYDGKTKTNR